MIKIYLLNNKNNKKFIHFVQPKKIESEIIFLTNNISIIRIVRLPFREDTWMLFM